MKQNKKPTKFLSNTVRAGSFFHWLRSSRKLKIIVWITLTPILLILLLLTILLFLSLYDQYQQYERRQTAIATERAALDDIETKLADIRDRFNQANVAGGGWYIDSKYCYAKPDEMSRQIESRRCGIGLNNGKRTETKDIYTDDMIAVLIAAGYLPKGFEAEVKEFEARPSLGLPKGSIHKTFDLSLSNVMFITCGGGDDTLGQPGIGCSTDPYMSIAHYPCHPDTPDCDWKGRDKPWWNALLGSQERDLPGARNGDGKFLWF